MENVADALKMAFAVFIFVFALSLAFSTITQAKETADIVLFTNDKTNYYITSDFIKDDSGHLVEGRTVGIDTVISTLYRCKNETMAVQIIQPSGTTIFDSAEDKGKLNEKIKKFVEDNISTTDTYLEQFVEANHSGKTITEDDGSSIIVTKGGTKMYITYIQQ